MDLFGKPKQKKQINSFQVVVLKTSGMRGMAEDELRMNGKKAELSHYRIGYVGEDTQRMLEKRAVCEEETVLKLLNDCDLLSWDGFDGPHPKHVQDGIIFTLNATVNETQKISAKGSANFPKHYREFTDGLHAILNANN